MLKKKLWIPILIALFLVAVVAVCLLIKLQDHSSDELKDIGAHTYEVTEVAYEGGPYSFTVTAGENSPIYAITEDM